MIHPKTKPSVHSLSPGGISETNRHESQARHPVAALARGPGRGAALPHVPSISTCGILLPVLLRAAPHANQCFTCVPGRASGAHTRCAPSARAPPCPSRPEGGATEQRAKRRRGEGDARGRGARCVVQCKAVERLGGKCHAAAQEGRGRSERFLGAQQQRLKVVGFSYLGCSPQNQAARLTRAPVGLSRLAVVGTKPWRLCAGRAMSRPAWSNSVKRDSFK